MTVSTTPPTQPIEIVSFPVEGMTCASCVNRITRFLEKVDGVDGANVNLATESATVRFDPARVTIAGLAEAVDAAGYVALVDHTTAADQPADVTAATESREERDEAAARHLSDLRLRLVVAAAFDGPAPPRAGADDLRAVAPEPAHRSPGPARARDAGPALGRLALLRRRLASAPPSHRRHGHAHRRRDHGGVRLLAGDDPGRPASSGPRDWRRQTARCRCTSTPPP